MRLDKACSACILCHDAPCSKACSKCDPARIIRALRFENIEAAAAMLPDDYDRSWVEKSQKACPACVEIGDVLDELKVRKEHLEGYKGPMRSICPAICAASDRRIPSCSLLPWWRAITRCAPEPSKWDGQALRSRRCV